MLPESDNDARLMETIRGIFEHREDYDFAILDGILDELPSNINDGDVIGDLVNLYQNKTVAYKKIVKRANYLFMKGRSLFHQIYMDQRDLFQQQDSLSESINRAFDQELLLGSVSRQLPTINWRQLFQTCPWMRCLVFDDQQTTILDMLKKLCDTGKNASPTFK